MHCNTHKFPFFVSGIKRRIFGYSCTPGATMNGLIVVLTLGLFTSHFLPLQGLPIESLVVHMRRCKCAKQTSAVVDLKNFKSVQVFPQSVYCRRKEIILITKKDRKVCVDPNAAWIQDLLKHLTRRQT
ncbi:C-X-C motif chemokine 13 [Paroedura picta]|uniref:C-X-C motif chemokine 13 n=1 Tax=Paroedura picta TaxID=143630 RepID=UPI004056B7E6